MNKMKKLLAVLVAFVMCFTVFGMVASADNSFAPEVYLNLSYFDNKATIVTATISTSEPCGAIQGTLKYSGATFDTAKFIENSTDNQYELDQANNTIKFVVVTDNLVNGDTEWAFLNFKDLTGTPTFTLESVSVCNTGATELRDSFTVPAESIHVNVAIRTLGAQYREPDTNTTAALRFGACLKRNKSDASINTSDVNGTAIACGFIAGFDIIIKDYTGAKKPLNDYVTYNEQKEKVELLPDYENKGIVVKESSHYFSSTDSELIYTYAISGFINDGSSVLYKEQPLTDANFSVLPYVIYQKENGEVAVEYGTELSRTYNGVISISEKLQTKN